MGWLVRNPAVYAEPFRFRHDETIRAGHFTRQMALPWQADFFDCAKETVIFDADEEEPDTDVMTWWPTQRPDDVFPRGAPTRVPWARDRDDAPIDTKEQFLLEWRRLGFVVDTSGHRTRFEEVDREDARGRPRGQIGR